MIHPKICCLLLLFIYFPIMFSPAALGNVRQQPSPCTLMYWMSRWSSLCVQGPLFSPAVCSRLQQEEKEEEEEEAEACFGAMLNSCTLHCPVRPSSYLPACLPFFHRRQALVCEFSFSKSRVCLFSEIPDYIQLMFLTTSTTSSSSSSSCILLLQQQIQNYFFFFLNSSSSATDSKLFLLLLLQQQIQNYFFFFFFFNNRFKIISSSSSSTTDSKLFLLLLQQQQIQNYFFFFFFFFFFSNRFKIISSSSSSSSSSATDSKLFLLLVEFFFFFFFFFSSRFKSNLQLFTGLPFFFKHVPNFPNNFNYSKKLKFLPHAFCTEFIHRFLMMTEVLMMMMKKLLANDLQEF